SARTVQPSSTTSYPPFAQLATQRIAWIHLLEGRLLLAADFFHRLEISLEEFERQTSELVPADRAALIADTQHAIYWGRYAIEAHRRAEGGKPVPLNEPELALATSTTPSYYRMRLRDLLAEQGYQVDLAAQVHSTECHPSLTGQVEQRASLLASEGYHGQALAQHEIDWALRATSSTPNTEVDRAVLYGAFAPPPSAVQQGSRVLSSTGPRTTHALDCLSSVILAAYPRPYFDFYLAEANRRSISPTVLLAISRSESAFDPSAVSRVGALGLMQLMPQTAREIGLNSGQSLLDIDINISLGARYASELIRSYGGELSYAVAAYNAGRQPVERWKARYPDLPPHVWIERISYPETKEYTKRVLLAERVYAESLISASP
ncbi:MAG: lytic transglycosylase domain-containing protein, partial [Bdellovibrionales bacterium]|nr:lytic transglycosylase domain-containing protein [Bdellovibrionales bacterium]